MTVDFDFDQLLRERAKAASGKSQEGNQRELVVLADLTKDVREIDGFVFSQLVMAGTIHMMRNKPELNKINVFPVADGDTGTNMVNCLKKPCRNLFADPARDLVRASANLGADVLINGQGNSGTILSHFFIALASEFKERAGGRGALPVEEFSVVLGVVGEKMKDAVANPKDGTMVSVARDSCKVVGSGGFAGLHSLVGAWEAAAMEELAKTPDQLEVDGKYVLKEAGVVDSGAQGFAKVVQGMALACRGELEGAADFTALRSTGIRGDDAELPSVDHTVLDSAFRFCTESVIVLSEGKTKGGVEAALSALQTEGDCDSLVCVGAPAKSGKGEMCKVHVHTNTPEQIFAIVNTFTEEDVPIKEKVEDMYAERDEAHGGPEFDLANAKFSLMIDGAWFSQGLIQKCCELTPVFVMTENTSDAMLLGGPDENPQALCAELRRTPSKIFTAAPLPGQAKVVMENVLISKPGTDLLAVNLGTPFTATPRNVQAAADALAPELRSRVHCYDTMTLGENSLMGYEALRCAEKGMTALEALERVKYVEQRAYHLFFLGSTSVKKMAEWGRAGDIKAEDVEDGMFFAMGMSPGRLPSHERNPKIRAQHFMHPLQQTDAAVDAMYQCQKKELEEIKKNMKPGEVVRDFWINVNCRVDLAVAFGELVADILPCKEKPRVIEPTLVTALLLKYSEMFCMFWIDDAACNNATAN